MKTLTHLVNPDRLLLLWQAVDRKTNKPLGERFVVGEVRDESGQFYLHYFDGEDTQRAISEHGFAGLTAFPYAPEKTYNGSVKDALAKRVASPERSDYADYLRSYRLPADRALSLMQLLAYTGGGLAGDGFSFAYTFDKTTPPFDFTFEIAGFRHNEGMKIAPITQLFNQPVMLVEEPTNPSDPMAVAVIYDGIKLGFVPKGLATAVKQAILKQYQVSAFITRINGTKDRPSIYVMVEVR